MKHSLRVSIRRIVLVAAAMATGLSPAADFPTKTIRIVVTGGPGANLDVTTRSVAEQMSRNLGQPVIVENMASANGLLAIRHVAKRVPADGYTLLAASNTVVLAPAFNKDPGYDPIQDLVGIGDMQTFPLILVGPPSQPSKNLPELLAAARANPGGVSLANGGFGTSTHLPSLMLMQQAGIKLLLVPYKGNGQALPDVLGGRVNGLFDAGNTAGPLIREGKLRAFGVSTAKRMAAFPDIPTLAEQGLPNFDFKGFLALFAPAGTPKDVVKRLNEALRAATNSEPVRDQFKRGGNDAGTMNAVEFNDFIKLDAVRSAKLVNDLGIEKE